MVPALPAANPAASAAEAQARAMVESRYVMAIRRPRLWDKVRQDILHECSRPSFAKDKSALYKKPVGSGVEGLGIRFVEMALRCMTNVLTENRVIYEDEFRRVIFVAVTDLESNVTWPKEIAVTKTVERSKPLDDGSFISVRNNSQGRPVYTVAATDDDLLNKEWALVSKAIRACGLRLVPGDIQDEAEAEIRRVRLDAAAKDPDAERREIVDGFNRLNVPADQLLEYVGHPLETCSPAELADLRATWGTIRDGETTWAAVLEASRKEDKKEGAKEVAGKKGRGVAAAEAKAKAEAEAKGANRPPVSEGGRGVVDTTTGDLLFESTGDPKPGDVLTFKEKRFTVQTVSPKQIGVTPA